MSGIPAERMSAHIPSPPPYFATVPSRGDLVLERQNGDGSLGRRSVVIAFACATGFLPHRRPYPGHSPSSDLYEPSTLPPRSPRSIHTVPIHGHNRFGAMTAPGAMSTYGSATVSASGDTQPSTVLVPAPQSHRSMMHASTMTPSHAALSRGSLLAMASPVTALLTEHTDIMTHNPKKTPVWSSFKQYGGTRDGSSQSSLNILLSLPMDYRERQLPQRSDHWSYRIVSSGFLFSTPGIPPGAVWANEARGYHRNRDPKETWALITWLTSAIHPHTRMTGGLRGGKPAIVAPIGSPTTWIRHSGVNLSGRGLHSYGWLI
uniref:Cytochrome c heme attachment protein n=1 Tax=Selaginella doederleinii TaxID=186426 RepID=A0A482CIN0_9TRAC|nr:cytochrome c heme attachment protein [Selaginella doederleinii]QBL76078.1 cytochrome c heme attachment protein [Selaginella doederleinii]